jgi:cation diffusion facilitator CzcD-associated flavoprotein CzcO
MPLQNMWTGCYRILASLYLNLPAHFRQYQGLTSLSAPGCKRLVLDPGYLDALKQQNVNLRWDRIDGIVEEGIRLTTGEVVPLDVIIYATGFTIYVSEVFCVQMHFQS